MGPADAPVALGRGRHETHGLPRAQQRSVVQQLRPFECGLATILGGALCSVQQLGGPLLQGVKMSLNTCAQLLLAGYIG